MSDGTPRRDPAMVSVVVPCRDAEHTLALQLEALAGQTYEGRWEVVVADNGSTDGSRGVVERWAGRVPGLRVVDASERPGVSPARNAGVRASTGAVVLLCDADDVADPQWVAELASFLAGGRGDLAGGALRRGALQPDGTMTTGATTVDEGLGEHFGFLPYAVGANCGFRYEVFDRLGGFDESYRAGGDEVEFCWRAQLAGYRLGFAPGAVMHYRPRQGAWAHARQSYGYGKAYPRLYHDFRRLGMPRPSAVRGAAAWWWLVRHLSWLGRRGTERDDWFRGAGIHLGRLVGSVRWRVVYL